MNAHFKFKSRKPHKLPFSIGKLFLLIGNDFFFLVFELSPLHTKVETHLYESGPPVMLTGIFDALSGSTLNTSSCPVLWRDPDMGCLSTWKGTSPNLGS